MSKNSAKKDLVDVLRKAFECVCGGGRCSKLSLEYSADDNRFTIIVDEDGLRAGVFGGSIGGYGWGVLTKYEDYYEFRSFERDEWGTGFNVFRVSEDDIRFVVEGVEALAPCSPDLSFLLDKGGEIVDVVSEFSSAVERAGIEDGFSYHWGFCSIHVDLEEGDVHTALYCEWLDDVMSVEGWEMGRSVSFKRIHGGNAVAWVIYDKYDNEVRIAVNASFVSDVAAFYRELREKLESRLDEVEGVLKGPAKKVYLRMLFP